MKKILLLWIVLGVISAHGLTLEELKMQKRFGIGVSAAGPLSLMGVEIDVNFTEEFSVSAGLGTAMDYNTWMLKGKYYFLGKWVSPYFALGVANWWTGQASNGDLKPSSFTSKFFDPNDDLSNGFSLWLVYPAFGVQFMHPMGIGFYAEIQYFFKLLNFANGLYAGTGVHWYF